MADPFGDDVRRHLALALDFDDLVAAERVARSVRPWFGVVKVGLELFSAAGPDAVSALVAEGVDVFVDLKLHDIPTTVGRAARVLGVLGARYVTMHAAGGDEMLRAGVDGLAEGARGAGVDAPLALGVTVLTSETTAAPDVLTARVKATVAAGCGGAVCAASDVATVRQAGPDLRIVVPGIRPAGADTHDQARAATPAAAIAAGADLLVVGRSVTAADDPPAAAAAIAAEVQAAIG